MVNIITKFSEFDVNKLNEKKVTVKRKYTDNHPSISINGNAQVRNSILQFVKSNDGSVTANEMKTYIHGIGEERGKKISSSWLSSNKKYIKRIKEGSTYVYKLTSEGLKLIDKLTLMEDDNTLQPTDLSGMGDNTDVTDYYDDDEDDVEDDPELNEEYTEKMNPDLYYEGKGELYKAFSDWCADISENWEENEHNMGIYEVYREGAKEVIEEVTRMLNSEIINRKYKIKIIFK